MITAILVSICALVALFLSYRYAKARPEGFPPGPPRIPLFGSYLFMILSNVKYIHKGVLNFSKWYNSDIVGFYVGPFPVVAIHNPDAIRQVLYNEVYDGRPQVFLSKMRSPTFEVEGIFFKDGPIWKEQRRFILRHLRDFGFGRRFQDLELVMQQEMSDLLDLIRNGPRYEHENFLVKKGGYRIHMPYTMNPISGNSVFHMMFNERFLRSEQADLVALVRFVMHFQRNGDVYGKLLSIMPWIRHVFPNWSSYNAILEADVYMYKFFEKIIDRLMRTQDSGMDRCFIDLYTTEMKRQLEQNKATTFSREQLIMSMIDFAFPALSVSGVIISFLIHYCILYPEVLKRIQNEIDHVVGSGRLPTLDDRKDMPFTEATIREIMRIETLVPSSVPHMAQEDTELMGYKIPKNTVVIASLYAYHSDERVWGDPQNFRPERFLDENGKLCLKKDVSFPFGAGKRLCAGETFGRNMIFLQWATLCQNFNFVLGPGDKMPDPSTYLGGIITSPPDFWVQLEERK